MISLTIYICLWLNFFVLAPPSMDVNQRSSLENFTLITSYISNANFHHHHHQQQQTKNNRTITDINQQQFDISSYRSSWKFVDKNTIRVRFRLYESLLQSIKAQRFFVRHLQSNKIETYDEQNEIINSTLTLYLHDLKHGRHIVCLLLYRFKRMISPRYVFCQDIVFNFHKYGNHDIDSDDHGNTFVFLLTQYSIVLGFLCILQLVHAGRKRRFLRTVYEKANALRNLMSEYHHRSQETKSTRDINPQTHALEYLIYNLNRNVLDKSGQIYRGQTNIEEEDSPLSNRQKSEYEKYLQIPRRLSRRSIAPLLEHDRLLAKIDSDEEIFDESDFETQSYEEQSLSYKSVSHILEESKPWMVKLTDSGSIQHAILSSDSARVHHL